MAAHCSFILRLKVKTTSNSIGNKTKIMIVLLKNFHLNGHPKVLSLDLKVRITLTSIINSTKGKYCSVALI